jgi:3D (Asp-Asp-Asp) domain-containing protein
MNAAKKTLSIVLLGFFGMCFIVAPLLTPSLALAQGWALITPQGVPTSPPVATPQGQATILPAPSAAQTTAVKSTKSTDAYSKSCSASTCKFIFLAPLPIEGIGKSGEFELGGDGATAYVRGLYIFGVAVAAGLAVIMIVVGGIEMTTVDAMSGKIDGGGRKKINAALSGLALALLSYLILSTLNVSLLSSNFVPAQIDADSSIGKGDGGNIVVVSGPAYPPGFVGPLPGAGGSGMVGRGYINSLPLSSRGSDGRLNFSVYGYTGDLTPDTNTQQRRGNSNNLLREGSIALSPNLISQYHPAIGSAVYVNGNHVGYYEDTTGTGSFNTIDIYDPSGSYGGNSFFRATPAGTWNISFGPARAQIRNP